MATTWGFHGEAGMRAWDVVSTTPDSLELALDLDTAPLGCPPCVSRRWPGADGRDDRPQRLVAIGRVPVGRTPDVRRGVRRRRDPGDRRRNVPRGDGRQRDRRERRRHDPLAWPRRARRRVPRPYPGAFTATIPVRLPRRRARGDVPAPQRPPRTRGAAVVAAGGLPGRLAVGGDRASPRTLPGTARHTPSASSRMSPIRPSG